MSIRGRIDSSRGEGRIVDALSTAFETVSESMGELIDGFYTRAVVGNVDTVGITPYLVWYLIAGGLLVALVMAFKKRCSSEDHVPHGPFVNGVESLVDFIRNDVCRGTLGDTWKSHFPFLATLFLMVLLCNLVGMLPTWKPGSGSTGMTAGIAAMSFFYFVMVGVKVRGGWGYIKSLAPKGVMFPINIVVWAIEVFSTFLRLVTLSVRLFCNMFAGHMVMGVFALMCTIFVEPLFASITAQTLGVASMSILWMVLLVLIYAVELMVAFIQAYVFALLSAVYVQLAEADH